MVTLLVYLIMAITLLGSVGYSVYTFQRSAEMVALAGRNASHMEAIVSLMRASLRHDVGSPLAPVSYMAPIGDPDPSGTHRMRLPAWVVGDDHTPWGGRYGWCPMAPQGSVTGAANPDASTSQDAAGHVVAGTSSGYDVANDWVSDDRGRGHAYAAAMSWPGAPGLPPDVLGVVVSPAPLSNATPDCGDVTSRDGYLVVDPSRGGGIAGSAAAVSTSGLVLTTSLGQTSSSFIHAAPADAGKGDGSDVADAMSLRRALGYWHSYEPATLTIVLAPGAYALEGPQQDGSYPADLSLDPSTVPAAGVSAQRSSFHLEGPSSGTATLAAAAGSVDLLLGVDMQVDGNVTVDPSVTTHVLPHAIVSMAVGGAGPVSVEGGDLTLAAGTVTSFAMASGTANVSATKLGSATLSGGMADLAASSLGSLSVSGGVHAMTVDSVAGVSVAAGDAHLVLTTAVTGATLNVSGGRLRLSSNAALSAAATFSGGSLALDGVAVAASQAPSVTSPGTLVTLANGATLSYGGKAYATAAAFWDALPSATANVTSTGPDGNGCKADGSPCIAQCQAPRPYVVGGECSPRNTDTLLAGSGLGTVTDAQGNAVPEAWSCRFLPATVPVPTSVMGMTFNQAMAATDAAGASTARCSAVAR